MRGPYDQPHQPGSNGYTQVPSAAEQQYLDVISQEGMIQTYDDSMEVDNDEDSTYASRVPSTPSLSNGSTSVSSVSSVSTSSQQSNAYPLYVPILILKQRDDLCVVEYLPGLH